MDILSTQFSYGTTSKKEERRVQKNKITIYFFSHVIKLVSMKFTCRRGNVLVDLFKKIVQYKKYYLFQLLGGNFK
jgi:hypothetical protein